MAWRHGYHVARLVWLVTYGRPDVPEGLWIYRVCATKGCVNSAHLAAFKEKKPLLVRETVAKKGPLTEYIFPVGHPRAGELDADRLWPKHAQPKGVMLQFPDFPPPPAG